MQSFKSVNPIVITAQNSLYEIQKKFGVKRIGIFGSCARNEQNKTSDVDVLAYVIG